MHKDFSDWKAEHEDHDCSMIEAGGFLYLVCDECAVMQTVDEIDAGLPVGKKRN